MLCGEQPCDPLSAMAGKHKTEFLSFSFLSLPPRLRMSGEYTQFAATCRSSVMKKYGAYRIISGVGHNGVIVEGEESCIGANMRRLHKGVWIQLPEPGTGAPRWWRLRAWFILIQADMLGRWQLGPCVESSQATHPCDKCNFSTLRINCYEACVFLVPPCSKKRRGHGSTASFGSTNDNEPKVLWTERSTELLDSQVRHFKSLTSDAQRKRYTHETGIKQSVYAFQSECM